MAKKGKKGPALEALPLEVLENICRHLDSASKLALMESSRDVGDRLDGSARIWKAAWMGEGTLRIEKQIPIYPRYLMPKEPVRIGHDGRPLYSTGQVQSGESKMATRWKSRFLSRMNLREGRCEAWRLTVPDGPGEPPVERVTASTPAAPFRCSDKADRTNSRVWQDANYLVVSHFGYTRVDFFHKIHVWRRCGAAGPGLAYTRDVRHLYNVGASIMKAFLYKNYFVTLPVSSFETIIAVHDLDKRMELVHQYSLPDKGDRRQDRDRDRAVPMPDPGSIFLVGDKAVVLCNVASDVGRMRLFVFSLPECRLLRSTRLFSVISMAMHCRHSESGWPKLARACTGQRLVLSHSSYLILVDLEPLMKGTRDIVDIKMRNLTKVAAVTRDAHIICNYESGDLVVYRLGQSPLNRYCLSREQVARTLSTHSEPTDRASVCLSPSEDKICALYRFSKSGHWAIHSYSTEGSLLQKMRLDATWRNSRKVLLACTDAHVAVADGTRVAVWNLATGEHLTAINLAALPTRPRGIPDYVFKFSESEEGIDIILRVNETSATAVVKF